MFASRATKSTSRLNLTAKKDRRFLLQASFRSGGNKRDFCLHRLHFTFTLLLHFCSTFERECDGVSVELCSFAFVVGLKLPSSPTHSTATNSKERPANDTRKKNNFKFHQTLSSFTLFVIKRHTVYVETSTIAIITKTVTSRLRYN